HMRSERCISRVVPGGLSFLHGRTNPGDLDRFRPIFRYTVDVPGVFDEVALVQTEGEMIQQIWRDDVVVVETVIADILCSVPTARRNTLYRSDIGCCGG